jgi:hypothetical protein
MTIEELETIRKKWYRDFNKKPNLLTKGMQSALTIRSWYDLKNTWNKVAKHFIS